MTSMLDIIIFSLLASLARECFSLKYITIILAS